MGICLDHQDLVFWSGQHVIFSSNCAKFLPSLELPSWKKLLEKRWTIPTQFNFPGTETKLSQRKLVFKTSDSETIQYLAASSESLVVGGPALRQPQTELTNHIWSTTTEAWNNNCISKRTSFTTDIHRFLFNHHSIQKSSTVLLLGSSSRDIIIVVCLCGAVVITWAANHREASSASHRLTD